MTAATATVPTLERRRERRVPVHLPMLVRGNDTHGEWFEERTTSQDICRGGTAFATQYALEMGARVEISIPAAHAGAKDEEEFATHGRIVHIRRAADDLPLIVGVEFTGPHFYRIFVSELT